MASDLNFVEYICDQARATGGLSFRKMFGEFALYHQGKVVALVCDNQLFVKVTEAGQAVLAEPTFGAPYPGAKPHLQVTDLIDDAELLVRLISITSNALPEPKVKVKTKAKKIAKAVTQGKAKKLNAIDTAQPIAALAKLANLGPKSAAILYSAGIKNFAELQKLGSVAAYAKAKVFDSKVSLNLLWALEGALTSSDWKAVARQHKTSLLLALDSYTQQK